MCIFHVYKISILTTLKMARPRSKPPPKTNKTVAQQRATASAIPNRTPDRPPAVANDDSPDPIFMNRRARSSAASTSYDSNSYSTSAVDTTSGSDATRQSILSRRHPTIPEDRESDSSDDESVDESATGVSVTEESHATEANSSHNVSRTSMSNARASIDSSRTSSRRSSVSGGETSVRQEQTSGKKRKLPTARGGPRSKRANPPPIEEPFNGTSGADDDEQDNDDEENAEEVAVAGGVEQEEEEVHSESGEEQEIEETAGNSDSDVSEDEEQDLPDNEQSSHAMSAADGNCNNDSDVGDGQHSDDNPEPGNVPVEVAVNNPIDNEPAEEEPLLKNVIAPQSPVVDKNKSRRKNANPKKRQTARKSTSKPSTDTNKPKTKMQRNRTMLKDIARLQNSTDPMIARLPFQRCVNDFTSYTQHSNAFDSHHSLVLVISDSFEKY